MQQKNETVKVVLIGDFDQKLEFVKKVSLNPISNTAMDFLKAKGNGKDYQVWDMAFQNSPMAHYYTKGAKVIIYLDPTPAHKDKFEVKRDKNECLAIDFNAVGLEPQQLMDKLDIFISEHQNELAKVSTLPTNAKFLFFAGTDSKSNFSSLPKELLQNIGKSMISSSISIFNLENPAKPIYISVPQPSPKIEIKSTVAEKKPVKTEVEESQDTGSSCVIS